MKKTRRFGISAKMFVSFGLVLLFLLFIGLFSIYRLDQVNKASSEIETVWLKKTGLIGNMVELFLDYKNNEYVHILSYDAATMSSLEGSIKGVFDQLVQVSEEYAKLIASEEERAVFKTYSEALKNYANMHDQAMEMSKRSMKQEAAGVATTSLRTLSGQVTTILRQMKEQNGAAATKASRNANDVYAASERSILLVIGISVLFALVLARTTARMITKNLQHAIEFASSIASGDLSAVLETKRGDEIGNLIRALGDMAENLSRLVVSIQEKMKELSDMGGSLQNHMAQTSASVVQINTNIDTIKNTIIEQSAGVTETSSAVEQITQNIQSLTAMIENQASSVTESSASIEEMVSNIRSVTVNIEKMGDNFGNLVAASENGKSKLNQVNRQIREISEQSAKLLETNTIIANISSQTNLLAMNAAIEAAHAGDAGRGFAVVADEIRKLAEMSSVQSKETKKELKSVIEVIETVVDSSKEAETAFELIMERINQVNNLVYEVKNSMVEQTAGSKEILTALTSINNVTSEVRNAAEEMKKGSASILQEISELIKLTEQVQTSIEQISRGTGDIGESVKLVDQLTTKNRELVAAITRETAVFKTRDDFGAEEA